MAWASSEWGDAVYTDLAQHKKAIEAYLEREAINLNTKNRRACSARPRGRSSANCWPRRSACWTSRPGIVAGFQPVFAGLRSGAQEAGLKLNAGEKRQIQGAVSWREDAAAKVVKKVHRLNGQKLAALLVELECSEADLPDFGYWPTEKLASTTSTRRTATCATRRMCR